MIAQALQDAFTTRSTAQTSAVGSASSIFAGFGFAGSPNTTPVNQNSALTLSAFYSGINTICNDFAKLPKSVYQKSDDGKSRSELANHPVKYLINKKPNQYMVSFNFDSILIKSAILKGNAYAYIERDKNTAQPIALQYVDQDITPVSVYKYNNKLWYKFDGNTIPAADMVHVPGFSFNGITGISVIQHAARSLGVGISAETFSAEYYDGKGVGTGVLTTTKSMDDTAKTRYSNALSAMFAKKAKWVVPIIDEASKFEHIKITPQEAQFLLSSEHAINEVARWLNINPIKLGNLKDSNNSITESLQIEHVSDSILPWAIKVQQEYDAKLFSSVELKAGLYTKFNTESLLSANKTAQADYWSKLIYNGVITINEVRAKLDLNPVDGGDIVRTPVNSQTPEQVDAALLQIKKQVTNG